MKLRERGLTLIEMLVVTTLVGLLAAVVAPAVGAGLETVRLRSTAERLAATLKLARDRAVRTRHYMEVTVDLPSRRVAVTDLEGDYQRAWEMPEGIAIGPQPAERGLAFVFPPDGAAPAVQVTLANRRGRVNRVQMDPLTAFPTVVEP